VTAYFRNIHQALQTVLVGMRITLQYCFAKTVTVQYPDLPPTVLPGCRGFHWYEIERCSACKACARACPVDCIYIETAGPRKVDKETGKVRGGAMKRWAIDYSKCMFCGLCTEPCPTECLKMGNLHDISCYDRQSAVVEFTELAQEGLRTPLPVWMRKKRLPAWAEKLKQEWIETARPQAEEMANATTEQPVAKPPPAPSAAPPAAVELPKSDPPAPAGQA